MTRKLAMLTVLIMALLMCQAISTGETAQAAIMNRQTIVVSEDKFVDNLGAYPIGEPLRFQEFLNHVGYYRYDGKTKGAMQGVLKYNLSGINRGRAIESVSLQFFLQLTAGSPFAKLWGSNDDNWTETDTKIPAKNVLLRDTDTTIAYGWNSFDVTDFIITQLAGDNVASFVLSGAETDPAPVAPLSLNFFGFQDRNNVDYAARLEIKYINSPPIELLLTNDVITENENAGTVVGNLSVIDPDMGDTATYSIVSGDSSAFTISGNELRTAAIFDFETKSSYNIGIRATDSAGNTYEKPFEITVSNFNEAPEGSFIVNGGGAVTNSQTIALSIAVNDPEGDPVEMRFSNDSTVWSAWEAFNSTKVWLLNSGDGNKTVLMELRDLAGNIRTISGMITLDTASPDTQLVSTPPAFTNSTSANFNVKSNEEGSIFQCSLDGNPYTVCASTNSIVGLGEGFHTLSVRAVDPAGNVDSTPATYTWTVDRTASVVTGVTNGMLTRDDLIIVFDEGTATLNGAAFTNGDTVSVEGDYTLVVTDNAGNSTTIHFVVDKSPPTGSVSINGGAARTNHTNVNLTLTSIDLHAVEMRFSSDNSSWSEWEGALASKNWTITDGDGIKTVYVQLKDAVGNMTDITDTIELLTAGPSVIGVMEGQLTNSDVTITFLEGGATLDGSVFTSGQSVTSDGNHTLVVTDTLGNSTTIHFTIDKTAPTGTVIVNSGDAETTNPDVILTITGEDEAGSGVKEMRFSNDNSHWNGWRPFASTAAWVLSQPNVTQAVYMELKDNAGNTSLNISDSIFYRSNVEINNSFVNGTEDTLLQFGVTDFVYSNVLPLQTIRILSLPTNGDLLLGQTAVRLNQEIDLSNIGGLVFDPNPNWNGPTSFEWQGNDGTNDSNTTAFMTINIAPVNDAPVVSDRSLLTKDGSLVSGHLSGNDVEGDALTFSIVDQPSSGDLKSINANSDEFIFKPQNGRYEAITFTYRAFDGTDYSNKATVTITNQRVDSDSGNSGGDNDGDSGSPVNTPVPQDWLVVIVNGQPQPKLAALRITNDGGQKVITAEVNAANLAEQLANVGQEPTFIIPVTAQSDKVVVTLDGQSAKSLDEKDASLEIRTPLGNLKLSTDQIQIDRLLAKFGGQVALADIKINVEISKSAQSNVQLIENDSVNQNYRSLVQPVDFSITVTYQGESIHVDTFSTFVERELFIPDAVDPDRITTAVVLNANGTVRHVPTFVTEKDGKYHAIIHSLTNSTYTLISSERGFEDAQQHWASSAIHDMVSRLIINGVNDQQFNPESSITRAEFAAIVVRALGLQSDGDTSSYHDIQSSDWFAGSVDKAQEYGIIEGYEDGNFRPLNTITRQESFVILSRAMHLVKMNTNITEQEVNSALMTLSDQETVDSWARQAVALAMRNQLVEGTDTGLLPTRSITRAETAALVQRLLNHANLIQAKVK